MERVELDWSLHKAIFEMFPGPASTATTLCFFFFFFNFIFKLYIIVLVLPNLCVIALVSSNASVLISCAYHLQPPTPVSHL